MASRKQYIEGIIENMHKIKRKMASDSNIFSNDSIKNITLSEWDVLRDFALLIVC